MTQTAVEWLFDRLQSEPFLTHEDFKQAKEMQEQQRKEAYNEGIKQGIKFAVNEEWGEEEGGAK
jgi:hypothetical protein